MKINISGKKVINIIDQTINMAVLCIMMLMVAYAGYALWDSNQLHSMADKAQFAVYKPSTKDEGKSFQELQALNNEVVGWLTLYGTNIDYPVTHSSDNMKYVNTTADGRYSLVGSIFLDAGNKGDFSDFNNILHGHHMAKNVMFGDIGTFADRKVFDAHQYGSLYFEEQEHGIEFFAFLHVDAYDSSVYTSGVREDNRQAYIDNMHDKMVHFRDVGVTADDKIVLLSTCSSGSTNGRDILVGRVTDELFEDPFINLNKNTGYQFYGEGGFFSENRVLIGIFVVLLAGLGSGLYYRRRHRYEAR